MRGLATTFTERRGGFDAGGRDAVTKSERASTEPGSRSRSSTTPPPAPLHVEVIGLPGFRQGGFGQPLAFFGTTKAFADLLAKVLKHGAPREVIGGSATGLSATEA